ncbi:MAG: rhodanese-like domain-containing protein, partial [Methylococcaceae bacterium]|nr:rhodanese-like domain-containing protein [Methylococcaceae bacterium]
MQQISPVELYKRLKIGETHPLLLDVRDPHEFGYCHIEGSINIPMNRIFAGTNELDP